MGKLCKSCNKRMTVQSLESNDDDHVHLHYICETRGHPYYCNTIKKWVG